MFQTCLNWNVHVQGVSRFPPFGGQCIIQFFDQQPILPWGSLQALRRACGLGGNRGSRRDNPMGCSGFWGDPQGWGACNMELGNGFYMSEAPIWINSWHFWSLCHPLSPKPTMWVMSGCSKGSHHWPPQAWSMWSMPWKLWRPSLERKDIWKTWSETQQADGCFLIWGFIWVLNKQQAIRMFSDLLGTFLHPPYIHLQGSYCKLYGETSYGQVYRMGQWGHYFPGTSIIQG